MQKTEWIRPDLDCIIESLPENAGGEGDKLVGIGSAISQTLRRYRKCRSLLYSRHGWYSFINFLKYNIFHLFKILGEQ